MPASMYIVTEGDDPGFDTFVNGRALARNERLLAEMARRVGVRGFIDYFSADVNAMSLLIEEGAGDPALLDKLPAPQWYSPADGLETVVALMDELRRQPLEPGSEAAEMYEELEEFADVLRKAMLRDVRWHMAVSWR